jgi:hypothetical protein
MTKANVSKKGTLLQISQQEQSEGTLSENFNSVTKTTATENISSVENDYLQHLSNSNKGKEPIYSLKNKPD